MPCKYKMFTELIEIIFNKFYENKVFKCHQMITNRSSKLKNLQRLGGGHPLPNPPPARSLRSLCHLGKILEITLRSSEEDEWDFRMRYTLNSARWVSVLSLLSPCLLTMTGACHQTNRGCLYWSICESSFIVKNTEEIKPTHDNCKDFAVPWASWR